MPRQRSAQFIILMALSIYSNLIVECRPNYNYNSEFDQTLQPDYISPEQENMQEYYDKINLISENDPNFVSNWPFLVELLRLRDLSSKNTNQFEVIPTPQPLQQIQVQSNRNLIKDSAQKKNSNSRRNLPRNEYMHACHFKICNMGRKRNVRYDY